MPHLQYSAPQPLWHSTACGSVQMCGNGSRRWPLSSGSIVSMAAATAFAADADSPAGGAAARSARSTISLHATWSSTEPACITVVGVGRHQRTPSAVAWIIEERERSPGGKSQLVHNQNHSSPKGDRVNAPRRGDGGAAPTVTCNPSSSTYCTGAKY